MAQPQAPSTLTSVKPLVNVNYSNTFANHFGTGLDDGATKGEIETSALGKPKLGEVEFTDFELAVHDYVMAKLGHPVIRVELTPFQIKLAIEEAVSRMQHHAPLWATQFATFTTTPRVGLYEIPRYMLEGLTYVVYKKAILSIQSLAGTFEQDFFIRYFQENFIFQDFAIGDFYLLQSHLEMIRKVLGNDGSWNIVNNQYLQLFPTPVVGGDKNLQ